MNDAPTNKVDTTEMSPEVAAYLAACEQSTESIDLAVAYENGDLAAVQRFFAASIAMMDQLLSGVPYPSIDAMAV